MNYNEMTIEELKEYAKSEYGISIGNIGKQKLITKIEEAEKEKTILSNIIEDKDLNPIVEETQKEIEEVKEYTSKQTQTEKASSLLDSINDMVVEENDTTGSDLADLEKIDLPNDTLIEVMSFTYGGLTYKSSSTNAKFRWNKFGAVETMTVAEINEMNNNKPEYLNKPYVILKNELAIRKFRLIPVYENVAKINNLSKLFKKDIDTIEKAIDDALKVNMRDFIISKVRKMYKDKTLSDINVIKSLEKKLNFDLQLDDAD